jgi:hypothetical protein
VGTVLRHWCSTSSYSTACNVGSALWRHETFLAEWGGERRCWDFSMRNLVKRHSCCEKKYFEEIVCEKSYWKVIFSHFSDFEKSGEVVVSQLLRDWVKENCLRPSSSNIGRPSLKKKGFKNCLFIQ